MPGYGAAILSSSIYAEGFGSGSYARLDVRSYQGLDSTINQSLLPYVLPRYEYAFQGQPDALGGRLSVNTQEFDVLRDVGTNDQRFAAGVDWNRPFAGALGDRWLVTLDAKAAVYHATSIDEQPNFGAGSEVETGHAQAQAAVRLNWPFVRAAGRGSQNHRADPAGDRCAEFGQQRARQDPQRGCTGL